MMRYLVFTLSILFLFGCNNEELAEIYTTNTQSELFRAKLILNKSGIETRVIESKKGFSISVLSENEFTAIDLLDTRGFYNRNPELDTLLEGRFGSTLSMQALKTNLFQERKLQYALLSITGVVDAHVTITNKDEGSPYISVLVIVKENTSEDIEQKLTSFIQYATGSVSKRNINVEFIMVS